MEKFPAIFTTLRSNLTFILAIPIFWLCFVLLYQPSSVVELLHMRQDMLNFNATIIMCILLGVMIISRSVLIVLHRTHLPCYCFTKCSLRNKSFTVFTGLKVSNGTSTNIVVQLAILPFHSPGSSCDFTT